MKIRRYVSSFFIFYKPLFVFTLYFSIMFLLLLLLLLSCSFDLVVPIDLILVVVEVLFCLV